MNTTGATEVSSISCGSPGNCAAVGDYSDRLHGFEVTERKGLWGRATQIPGLNALNRARQTIVSSVSCASAGNCAAAGEYAVPTGSPDDAALGAFVVNQRNGVWGKAIAVPGLGTLYMNNGGDDELAIMSCPTAIYCAAGGTYGDRHGHLRGFVVSERHCH